MRQPMFLLYLQWHFLEAPRTIFKSVKNVLSFNLEYFSVVLLLKTLFSPWKRYQWSHTGGFSIKKSIDDLVSNLISRTIGAVLRGFIIIIGLITEVALLTTGVFILLGWIVLPLLIILSLFYGIRLLI